MENEKLITARETAKQLGISKPTLSRLVKSKQIGVFRVGQKTMFDKRIIEGYLRGVFVEPNSKKNEEL